LVLEERFVIGRLIEFLRHFVSGRHPTLEQRITSLESGLDATNANVAQTNANVAQTNADVTQLGNELTALKAAGGARAYAVVLIDGALQPKFDPDRTKNFTSVTRIDVGTYVLAPNPKSRVKPDAMPAVVSIAQGWGGDALVIATPDVSSRPNEYVVLIGYYDPSAVGQHFSLVDAAFTIVVP
jgi:hypothetical protein